jgi:hypothetical protein
MKKKMVVPAVCIGIAALAFVAWYVRFHQGMYVQRVDQSGKPIGKAKWVKTPEPDRIASNGLSQVESYVTRLVQSQGTSCSLDIFTPDGQRGLGLTRSDDQVILNLIVNQRNEPDKERAIRDFFKEKSIAPVSDVPVSVGGVPDAVRALGYPVSGDAHEVAALCQQVLKDLYGITAEEALDFTFEESTGNKKQ